MFKLELVEYTPAAQKRSFDPYNSARNFETPFSENSKSERTANVLLAKAAKANKRYS